MEIIIRNRQRLIKINRPRIARILKKALIHLARKDNNTLPLFRYKGKKRSYYQLIPLKSVEISVLLISDSGIRKLNRCYRGIDKTTDVLSFPQTESIILGTELQSPDYILGDIVINIHQAKRQAEEYGITFYEEVTRLLIHGLLHLLGYDHEKDGYQAAKMKRKELEILGGIG
jgi:probable rRNA maturation factor